MLVKEKIVYSRRKMGISSTKLAEMIGVNQGTINRYENGAIKTIPTEKLRKLAEALGCSFEEFISGDPHYMGLLGGSDTDHPAVFTQEDERLILDFHKLPGEYQSLIRAFITLAAKSE